MINIKVLKNAVISSVFLFGSFSNAGEIHINVKGIRNQNGHIVCGLFNAEKGYPSEPKGNALIVLKVAATKSEVACQFSSLKAGTFAVSVLHDENDNDKMDTNFLGIPKEGYGASLNHYHSTSAPTFSENKLDITEVEKKELNIDLQY
jgi:uncharacterized protein (DUF2141 family)